MGSTSWSAILVTKELDQLHDLCFKFSHEQIAQGTDPLEMASVLMTQALTLYRSLLDEEGYKFIIQYIMQNQDRVPLLPSADPSQLH